MDEQARQERTGGNHLGALAVDAAYARDVERAAERDFTYTVGLRHHPSAEELAALTSRLLTHCAVFADEVTAIPAAARPARGGHALETWNHLRENGPESGPLGNWSYAKHLAQAARDILQALREHRPARVPASAPAPASAPTPPDPRTRQTT
ncbi:DUF6415 family natural product biosynthesis protein [Streptomyces laurentii]|uniref:DUF6415 family natural product biosynthesis protein n=1 Tax=Streptomyces laurentii TaxID=39478 RepID=UPI0036980418